MAVLFQIESLGCLHHDGLVSLLALRRSPAASVEVSELSTANWLATALPNCGHSRVRSRQTYGLSMTGSSWEVSADLTLASVTAAAPQVYRCNAVEVYRKSLRWCSV